MIKTYNKYNPVPRCNMKYKVSYNFHLLSLNKAIQTQTLQTEIIFICKHLVIFNYIIVNRVISSHIKCHQNNAFTQKNIYYLTYDRLTLNIHKYELVFLKNKFNFTQVEFDTRSDMYMNNSYMIKTIHTKTETYIM